MTVTADDIEARLGRAFQDSEQSRVDWLIADVIASLQVFTGQLFTRDDYTFRARVKRRTVRLPQRPVHSVDSVTNIDGDDVDFTWDGLDKVRVATIASDFEGDLCAPAVVDVTYDAGPDEFPPALVGVVSNIVLRALGVDPTEAGMSQESIDGYSYTVGSVGGAGAYGILPAEARVLAAFGGRKIGTIRVSP